jgi:pyruvate kinase
LEEFSNPEGEVLVASQKFRLDMDPSKEDRPRVQLPHPEIIAGHHLLVDDGKVKLVLSAKGHNYLDCAVEVAGKVMDRKGVNTPDSVLAISALTPKDRIGNRLDRLVLFANTRGYSGNLIPLLIKSSPGDRFVHPSWPS